MRKSTGEWHGIRRVICANGEIIEQSFINDKQFGLSIKFWSGSISVRLYRDDKQLAFFRFDKNFCERVDSPNHRTGSLLDSLTPAHFNPSVEDTKPYKAPILHSDGELRVTQIRCPEACGKNLTFAN